MLMVEPRKNEYSNRERRRQHGHGLDCVDRKRAALRRIAVVVEAEVVALAHAVDGDRVVAVVDAGNLERVVVGRVHPGLGVDAHHVLDVAADGREFPDLPGAIAAVSADRHVTPEGAHHFDARKLGDRQCDQRHRRPLGEPCVRDLDRRLLHTFRLRRHAIRAADAQTRRAEGTVGAGARKLGGAGRQVHD